MAEYTVTIPIAGHLIISVEAESASAAVEKAMDEATIEHLDSWEQLEQFHQGNVCYCPRPWELTVVNDDTGEEEEVEEAA